MPKDIHDKFDKAEAIIDRTKKLLLKITTAIVGIIVGLFVALEQLDYHLFDGDEDYIEAAPVPSIELSDSVEQFYEEEFNSYSKKGKVIEQVQQEQTQVEFIPETLPEEIYEEEYVEPDTIWLDTMPVPMDTFLLDTFIDTY